MKNNKCQKKHKFFCEMLEIRRNIKRKTLGVLFDVKIAVKQKKFQKITKLSKSKKKR